jgi:hypothetical protein
MSKGVKLNKNFNLTPMNEYIMFFVQTSTPISNIHQKLTELGKCCMQNNQLPTKNSVESSG